MFFTPKLVPILKQHIVSSHFFFRLNTLKSNAKAPAVDLFRLSALGSTKIAFLTPKKYDEHPVLFIWEFPSRVSLLQANHESELIKQLLLLLLLLLFFFFFFFFFFFYLLLLFLLLLLFFFFFFSFFFFFFFFFFFSLSSSSSSLLFRFRFCFPLLLIMRASLSH